MGRRDLLLQLIPALGAAGAPAQVQAQNTARPQPLLRTIASSGEQIPLVGLGSWITFNVGITTSEGNRHREFEHIMRGQRIDFVQFSYNLLDRIVSHPAVTCAIPATRNIAHVRENMGAALGRLPDEAFRQRMVAYVERL